MPLGMYGYVLKRGFVFVFGGGSPRNDHRCYFNLYVHVHVHVRVRVRVHAMYHAIYIQ